MSFHEKTPHPNPLGSNRNEYCADVPVGSDIYDNTPARSQDPGSPRSPRAEQSAAAETTPSSSSRGPGRPLRPFHHLAYKVGSESPFPQHMEAEIQKAARVLRAFTFDPAHPLEPLPRPYAEPGNDMVEAQANTSRKNNTLLPIPASVLAGAVGLAIFTSARIGLHASLSTGSGILIARLPDGSWGPPSAISVHSIGAGFLAGLDMSEIVCVINTEDALEAFTRAKVTLGPEVAIAAGPWGAGGGVGVVVEGCKRQQCRGKSSNSNEPQGHPTEDEDYMSEKMTKKELKEVERQRKKAAKEAKKKAAQAAVRTALRRPVYTYTRSRGLYAGLQIDGTVIGERSDANASFYGMQMPAKQILNGYVPPGRWIDALAGLYSVLHEVETRAPKLPPRPDAPQRRDTLLGSVAEQDGYKARHGDGEDGMKQIGQAGRREDDWEELPKYEDDGVARPGVGDEKVGN